ncbi:MAG: hypothetical protein AAGI46_06655 [Planctomycetota bacterium]
MSRGRRAAIRGLLLAAASLGVFGGVYLLTSVFLPDPALTSNGADELDQLPQPGKTPINDGIGPSEEVTFRIFDPDTNQPTADVEIGRYRRTGKTTVELEDVVVRLRAQGGATVMVQSPGGTVRVDPPAAGRQRQVDADAIAAADRARLSDVTIRWFPAEADGQSSLTMTLDNLLFDAGRLTVVTDDTTIDGRTVLGPDVPVVVRGDDLDFDGRGLRIDWDPVARRPSLVFVPGGGRATIKTRPEFLPEGLLPGDVTETTSLRPMLRGIQLAQASGSLPTPPSDEEAATPYDFSVAGPIRATQAGVVLLEAAEATGQLPLADDATTPTGEVVVVEEPEAPPSPVPSTPRTTVAPASEPTFEPIVLTWPGALELRTPPDAEPVSRAESELDLTAGGDIDRVLVRTATGVADADRIRYVGTDDLLTAFGSEASPVILQQDDGSRLVGPRVEVRPEGGIASVLGAGEARLPSDDDQPPTTLVWSRQCDFLFDAAGDGTLEQVDARGDVQVRDDALDLAAAALVVDLDADGELKAARATGNVDATLRGDTPARLRAARIWLDQQRRGLAIEAENNVIVDREDGTVEGDRLEALVVTEGEETTLSSLRIDGSVTLVDAAGRILRGDRATLAGEDEPVVVSSQDPRGVTLEIPMSRGDDDPADGPPALLAGETMVLDQADESLTVQGAGDLTQPVTDTTERRLTWTGVFTATEKRLDVSGDVRASGPSSAGPDAADLLLTSLEAAVLLDDAGEPDEVRASGTVRLTAEERDADQVVASFDLRADQVTARPQDEVIDVSVPGRILVRELREPEDDDGFRGVVALEWQERLRYEAETRQARATGAVVVAAEPIDAPAFRIDTDTLVATVTADEPQQFDSAVARGNVRLTSTSTTLDAGELTYSAATNEVTATGDNDRPVRVFDADGRPAGQFRVTVYDVATGRIVRVEDLVAGG